MSRKRKGSNKEIIHLKIFPTVNINTKDLIFEPTKRYKLITLTL